MKKHSRHLFELIDEKRNEGSSDADIGAKLYNVVVHAPTSTLLSQYSETRPEHTLKDPKKEFMSYLRGRMQTSIPELNSYELKTTEIESEIQSVEGKLVSLSENNMEVKPLLEKITNAFYEASKKHFEGKKDIFKSNTSYKIHLVYQRILDNLNQIKGE